MSSVLRGGRKRKRGFPRLLAILALLTAPAAVAAALYLGLHHGGASAHAPRTPLAAAAGKSPVSQPSPDELVGTPSVTDIDLKGVDAAHVPLRKPPKGLLMFDVDTGEVLLRHDPLRRLPIASLTKVMTALVVTEHSRPGDKVKITRSSLHYSGSGVGVLPKGKS